MPFGFRMDSCDDVGTRRSPAQSSILRVPFYVTTGRWHGGVSYVVAEGFSASTNKSIFIQVPTRATSEADPKKLRRAHMQVLSVFLWVDLILYFREVVVRVTSVSILAFVNCPSSNISMLVVSVNRASAGMLVHILDFYQENQWDVGHWMVADLVRPYEGGEYFCPGAALKPMSQEPGIRCKLGLTGLVIAVFY